MSWISALLLACLFTPQVLAAQIPSPAMRFPGSGGGGGPQSSVLNHEPVFGVGPHTTWRGGWGMELELESEGGELVVPVELLYGVTEELTVTAVLPFRNPVQNGSLGSVGFRAKWRFATVFSPGRADALAVVGGVTVPRASAGTPAGGPVITTGLAAGRNPGDGITSRGPGRQSSLRMKVGILEIASCSISLGAFGRGSRSTLPLTSSCSLRPTDARRGEPH